MADYSRLAAAMGKHPEMAQFRLFSSLNAKNLLYMQSELMHLECELASIAMEDRCSGDAEKASFHVSAFDLKESLGTSKGLQWEKVLQIRKKLKAYNQALLQYSQVKKLEKPKQVDLRLLQEWLDRPEGGDFFLCGREAEIWQQQEDLITFSRRQAESDSLTRLINEKLAPWYHNSWGRRVKQKSASEDNWDGLWNYEYTTLVAVANATSTVLSSLLPTTSILCLYLLGKPSARLIAIMLFTALFSITLTAVTNARRIDVFAATTAFAAVQVVFVGSVGFCST